MERIKMQFNDSPKCLVCKKGVIKSRNPPQIVGYGEALVVCQSCGARHILTLEGMYRTKIENSSRGKGLGHVYRAESDNQAAPVEIINSREGFFDEKQDAEYFGFGFIAGGLLVGVLGSVIGNIFSELLLDEMRINKFGYHQDSTGEKRSFWKLGE